MKKLVLLLSLLTTGGFITNCSAKTVSQETTTSNVSEASSKDVSLERFSSSSSSSSERFSSSSSSNKSSSSSKSSANNEGYKISQSTATMTMGEELQLSITNNGNKVNNVTWSTSDNQLTRVDQTGKVKACFFTDVNEVVTITGKVNNKSYTCKVTINPREDSIFSKCYYNSEGVNQDDEGHVIYMFVHAGLEANGTLLVNKTFEYDSFTNICKIKVSKSYTEGGVDAYYIGKNEFYWGDYRNGLFYGQYSEVYKGTQKDAMFSFKNIGFSYSSHTIMLQDATTYTLEESDWRTIQDESTVALGVFYRIQECSEYAEEKFQQYKFGVHLF